MLFNHDIYDFGNGYRCDRNMDRDLSFRLPNAP
jgi:hypothetical protein